MPISFRSTMLLAALAATAGAQGSGLRAPHQRPPGAVGHAMTFAGRTLDEWAARSLTDSSVLRRDRANAALRRAPPAFRASLVQRFVLALRDSSQARRLHGLQALEQLTSASQGELGMFDGNNDITPAIQALVLIARNPNDPLRLQAMWLLCTAGGQARDVVAPLAREVIHDSSAAMRSAGAAVLGTLADATDERALVGLLADRDPSVRARAAYSLGLLPRKHFAEPLARMLADPSPYVKAMALKALANTGPAARGALPAVVSMIGDTTHWRSGNYAETIGAEAAFATSRIVPRRGISAIPMKVDIDDRGNALRSDGLGGYVAGADSVDAFVSAALNLDLSGPRGDGRAARLPVVRALRRALVVDLNHPIVSSGAKSRGAVRDNEAVIHVYWSHVHNKRMVSITMLDPSDSAVTSERTEVQFRISGEPYLLQMGEWTEEEFNPRAPKINGRGTTPSRIWHPAADEWTVVAPPGSTARLWKMADPEHPVDLGLYACSFAISWSGFSPVETMGTLIPSPH